MHSITCLGSVYSGTDSKFLKLSLDSLLNGSIEPDQIVLVIDGPLSNAVSSVIDSYHSDSRFVFPFSKRNLGLGSALALGLTFCSSEFLCRFDTDDISHHDRLSQIINYFSTHPTVDVVGSFVLEYATSSSSYVSGQLKTVPLTHSSIVSTLSFRNPFNHPSVCFRKSVLDFVSYDDMPFFEDYFLWFKLKSHKFTFANIPLPLVAMRRGDLFERRSGIAYLFHEINFYRAVLISGLATFPFLFFFPVRFILRLFPNFFVRPFMKIWRNRITYTPNPDISFSHYL